MTLACARRRSLGALGVLIATTLAAVACVGERGAKSTAPAPEPVAPAVTPVAQAPVAPTPPAPAAAQTPTAPAADQHADEKKDDEKRDEKPRKGIPVTEPLIVKNCATCHQDQGGGLLGRISFLRKTPEGWEMSLKRMIRLQHITLSPEDAKSIVRYLSNENGLARAEAERAMYEVERRIHWSEDASDKELRQSCGECHTLGRVLAERRDETEWKYLKATHLAFFPLAQWQAFRGEREHVDWDSLSDEEAQDRWEEMNKPSQHDQADRVLEKLAQEQPLFTPAWEAWHVNRREVPVAGTWDVVGHEPSRGDVSGSVTITRTDADAYETAWDLHYEGGAKVTRKGKGLLYSGYSWRGRSTGDAAGEAPELREVLLLSDDWNELDGRIFSGEYNEIGADVKLLRRTGVTSIERVENPALAIPSQANALVLLGENFPSDLAIADFHVGDGVSVTKVERVDAQHVRLTVDVALAAKRGRREVSFRAVRGPDDVVLYDTIDYIDVTPHEGLARTGGKMRPPQIERFEAVAMNRGPDDELYTADDFRVKVVPATWSLEEFPVRENDDDIQFVGGLDPRTGVFTPAIDGPNPARRWEANNIGEVYVVATAKMTVRDVPPKSKLKPKSKPADAAGAKPTTPPVAAEPFNPASQAPVVMVEREFRARGRLLVMVPIYVQWDRYLWDRK